MGSVPVPRGFGCSEARGLSSLMRDGTHIPCTGRQTLKHWIPGKSRVGTGAFLKGSAPACPRLPPGEGAGGVPGPHADPLPAGASLPSPVLSSRRLSCDGAVTPAASPPWSSHSLEPQPPGLPVPKPGQIAQHCGVPRTPPGTCPLPHGRPRAQAEAQTPGSPSACLAGCLPRFTMSCCLKWRIHRFLSSRVSPQGPGLLLFQA